MKILKAGHLVIHLFQVLYIVVKLFQKNILCAFT